jgi:hypothetical protein
MVIGLFLAILIITACSPDKTAGDNETSACHADLDCSYIWYAGGCYTPAYVAAVMQKCQDKTGPCPAEAPKRENVTCTCEDNLCVTHG